MPLFPPTAHLAVASLNQTVGDWSGNTRRIAAAIAAARARGARLLLLPEMCIPGYSLGDRLPRWGTLERSWRALTELAALTEGMIVCLGLPVSHRGVIYNAMAVVADTKIAALTAKENLATGDVEYENRWYQPWARGRVETFTAPDGLQVPIGNLVFEAAGIGRFALEICEDGWKGLRPGSIYALAGAEILLNPSASWFVIGKHGVRRRMVEQISREDHVVYLYSSLLGCDATRLVFDGSVFVSVDGAVLDEGRRFLFKEDMELIDRVVDLAQLRQTRHEEGSWRQQVREVELGNHGPPPKMLRLEGSYRSDASAPPARPYWIPAPAPSPDPSLDWLHPAGLIPRPPRHEDLSHLELELALALALRDYVAKTGLRGLTLALSGGRDSSMVALLVHRMFRYDNPDLDDAALKALVNARFVCAYLATENSGDRTRDASRSLAEELGARFHDVGIQDAFDTHVRLIEGAVGRPLSWENDVDDIALQNVQARLRGSLIWMLANLDRFLLLSTSNKSEAAVGYTTMDGDTSGGISPIADVPKSLVSLWLRWAAEFHDYEAVSKVNAMQPTAELRPPEEAQTDEGDLMPFEVLDQLLYHFVQKGEDPLPLFKALWPRFRERYGGDPRAFAAHVRKFVRLLCFAQWKRERFAISFRVTAFDLDPKTGFRFPPVQAPFTEELAELDAYIATL
jgi:NAD+ synthase (glutamine-hydrolysing)